MKKKLILFSLCSLCFGLHSCFKKLSNSKDCICNTIYAPVCGEDGKTYANKCTANCEGVKVVKNGECP